MPRIRGTNLPQLGEFNQATLLESIRVGAGRSTRADLARATGLSTQTVTNVVRRLIEEGLVAESQQRRDGAVGRPGTTLRIVPDGRYAVGVHIDPAAVVLVVLDLSGRVVGQRVVGVAGPVEPAETLDLIAGEITTLLAATRVPWERVLGVGIATPGPVDRDAGVVLDPPYLTRWHDVPLRDELARRTGLPTLMDKDVLAVASAVLWFPETGQPHEAAVVYAGTGVALGVISGGAVARGVSGNAGEAGHLSVGRTFGPCSCEREDCLGGVLSTGNLAGHAATRGIDLAAVATGDIADPGDPAHGDRAAGALRTLAHTGQAAARALLADMGDALGTAAITVCDLLDLDTVVVSGPVWQQLGEWIEPGLRRRLAGHRTPGRHPLALLVPRAETHQAAIGAACLILDDLTPKAVGLLLA